MRNFIVAGNWKLNKSPKETKSFFEVFLSSLTEAQQSAFVFFPPAVNLSVTQECLKNTKIGWGAQNIYYENSGAFTGENSPQVIKEMGATHALIGHSERRSLFNETNGLVAKKVKAAQDNGLIPLLCVGESLEERERGETLQVITTQLKEGLKWADLKQKMIVAYEPVWAIGTGQVASPQQAQEAHQSLREELENIQKNLGDKISLLYGGSVKPDNAKTLSQQADIDGFLVGGASLKPDVFKEIFIHSQL